MIIRRSRRLVLLALGPLVACASLTGREPVIVDVVGVEPLPRQGMEGRFLVKLRVQNPNEALVEFVGVAGTPGRWNASAGCPSSAASMKARQIGAAVYVLVPFGIGALLALPTQTPATSCGV